MSKEKIVAFTVWEEVGIGINDYDFKGHTPKEAEQLVAQGKARWVLGPCATLTLEMVS